MAGKNKFIPGLELSRLYFETEVKPVLDKYFPRLKYSAALIGWGSDVLGFDTFQSTDHNWGPRLLLFLEEKGYPKLKNKISKTLSQQLPCKFMGYSANFSKPQANGVRHPENISSGRVNHMVEIFTVRQFFKMRLKFDLRKKITPSDWLHFPEHRLLEITSGEVFHDGLGELSSARKKFSYYPAEIWKYKLACQWGKISEEEAFAGRCHDVGDEIGAKIIAARIICEIIELCFLMEKTYAPYSKWLGTGFSKLKCSKKLLPIMKKALSSKTSEEQEKYLSQAYEIAAKMHNQLGITKPLSAKTTNYYGRPYKVIHADKFAEAIKSSIQNKSLKLFKKC